MTQTQKLREALAPLQVGRLPTMNQDPYPALGDWWVQLWDGSGDDAQVVARVYGSSPEQACQRAEAMCEALAMPTAPAEGGEVVKRKLIGWRTENFLWETDDPDKARNWEPNIGVLPIFEGDPNTKLTTQPASQEQAQQPEAQDHLPDAGKMAAQELPDPHIGLPWRHNAPDGSVHCSAFTREQMQAYGTECWKAGYKHGAWADKAVGELPDEPFGYFKAEPFGWADCAKDDEGAKPLYERPQVKRG